MRAIKKIMALTTGATMLGATLMGAMAADLADYPSPLFIEDNAFNGAIVVGDDAKSEDVVGAIDIATSLQYVTAATADTTTSDSVTVEGEAVKIQTSSDNLNIGDNLTDVKTVALDEDDLPTVLADETFAADDGDDFDYEQKIGLGDALEFSHWADSDYNDKEPTLGIRIPKGTLVSAYELDFKKDAESDVDSESDLEDIEDSSIVILGNTYDIVEADNATNVKLELMGGAVKDMMEQGQIKTYTIGEKDYEVEVTYIGGNPSKVKFKINGETTKTIEEDGTHKLGDGTQIGVREILEEEAGEVTADQVEFYIGAEKLTLENGEELELNDEDVDNVDVGITASFGSTTKIQKIQINWTADEDLFVTEDSEVLMPGLESFKLNYEGLTAPAGEEVKIEDGGDYVVELTAMFEDGEYTIDYLGSNETGGFDAVGGDGDTEGVPTVNATTNEDTLVISTANNAEDQYFIVTWIDSDGFESYQEAGESYILEIDDDDQEDGVDIKNVITNQVIEEDIQNGTTFTVGSATLELKTFVEDGHVNITDNNNDEVFFDRIVTKGGLLIYMPVEYTAADLGTGFQGINVTAGSQPTTFEIVMEEEDDSETVAGGEDINVTVGFTDDNEVKVSSLEESTLVGGEDLEVGDSDEYVGYVESALGTKTLLDKSPDQDTFKLVYYGTEVYGNVYVSESETGFGTASGVSGVTSPVKIPSAKLASEVTDVTAQNLLLVGGPCANAATAEAFGLESSVPGCLEGFEEGKAKIMVEEMSSGKVAMLVAGYSAMDTRMATRVVANYDDYALSGDEVEVTGTSLSDISVSAPSTTEDTEE